MLRLLLGLMGLVTGRAVPEAPAAEASNARLEFLREEVARHNARYFRDAAPEITDEAFDRLNEELETLEETLGRCDAGPSPADDRIPGEPEGVHRAPMLSLRKAYRSAQVEAFYEQWQRASGDVPFTVLVEPKFDGVAVSVVYEHGRFLRALTRGNGRIGQDISEHVRSLPDVPAQLSVGEAALPPAFVELRGEVYVEQADFERVNDEQRWRGEREFTQPRSLVAATLRHQESQWAAARNLRLVVFAIGAIEPVAHLPTTLEAAYAQAASWGLRPVQPLRRAATLDELREGLREFELGRCDLPFPTDGAVVKINEVLLQQKLGAAPGAPRWAFARKFPSGEAPSTLRAISWSIGRTGVLTPIAEFDPVTLGGAMVRRATLHHWHEVTTRDLRVGDRVTLERSGDVIPVLAAVDLTVRPATLKPYAAPTTCPECAGPLQKISVNLVCPNTDCPGRRCRAIEHFASSQGVGIAGLGPGLVRELVQQERLRSAADLYRLQADDLPRAGEKIVAAIDRSRQASLERVLQGLGVPLVGRQAARRLAQRFGSLAEWFAADAEEWSRAAGLSSAAVPALRAYQSDPATQQLVAELVRQRVGQGKRR